jgi:hypothetical protein
MPIPPNYSNFERTGNNAIDLVAQAVGYGFYSGKGIKEILLNPHFYHLFKAGVEALMKQEIHPDTDLVFLDVPIKKDSAVSGFKKIHIVYHNPVFNLN